MVYGCPSAHQPRYGGGETAAAGNVWPWVVGPTVQTAILSSVRRMRHG